MKRTWIIILSITTIVLFLVPMCSAESFSASYKIKVYIPPMVGVNIPAPNAQLTDELNENNTAWETTIEEVIRGNETVICKTTVVK